MLIQPDIDELGDKRLNPDEAVAKAKEDNHRIQAAKGLFLPRQEELENQVLSEGRRIGYREFIRRLSHANPRLLFKDGLPGNISVYAPKLRGDDDEPDPTKPDWWNDHRYVSGFACEDLTEFSSVTTTEHGIANREQRGWRSVLIALIKSRAISYCDAIKEFGEPTGERGWRWREQLHDYKRI